jgi:hypothetical protein
MPCRAASCRCEAIARGIDPRRHAGVQRREPARGGATSPMNQRAEDLIMGAPSEASPKQLRELHIRVVRATFVAPFCRPTEASRASAAATGSRVKYARFTRRK